MGFVGWGKRYHLVLSSSGHRLPRLLSEVGGGVNDDTLSAQWSILNAACSPQTDQPPPISVLIFPPIIC